ncbi:MAG: hypothetical protein LUF87_01875 [Alistipes sp.]|nr:hypothetical protein [Alistipes sp.]
MEAKKEVSLEYKHLDMKAVEIEARKANLITRILTGVYSEQALDELDKLVNNLASFPCTATEEQIHERFENGVKDYEAGKTIPLSSISRK